ncbi:MAG: hypothetical protein JXJ18_02690 [Rhodobacteraceae bacterium]|nr:hypothetical protein [Paracoccaceae bacterium]
MGDWDHEYGIRIAPDDMARFWPFLVRALLNEHGPMDVKDLRALCDVAGINPNFWSWT